MRDYGGLEFEVIEFDSEDVIVTSSICDSYGDDETPETPAE
jgi:hypothetical protein